MKKYRIIEYRDANDEVYYEVMIGTPTIIGERWKTQTIKFQGRTEIARYNNLNQAQYAVRSLKAKKTVIEEGILDDTEEN